MNFAKAENLKTLLTAVGRAVLDGSADFGTPVSDYAPEMLSLHADVKSRMPEGEVGARASIAPNGAADATEDEDEPLGILELRVDLDAANEDLVAATNEITELTYELGERVEAHTSRFEEIQARLGDQAPSALLAQARLAAQDYEAYATAIVAPRERMALALDKYFRFADLVARDFTIDTDEDLRAALETVDVLDAYAATLGETYGSTVDFAQTLSATPHVSRDLTRAIRRCAKEVNETATVIQGAHAEVARAANVLRERLDAPDGTTTGEADLAPPV
jgi:hypothetical protein